MATSSTQTKSDKRRERTQAPTAWSLGRLFLVDRRSLPSNSPIYWDYVDASTIDLRLISQTSLAGVFASIKTATEEARNELRAAAADAEELPPIAYWHRQRTARDRAKDAVVKAQERVNAARQKVREALAKEQDPGPPEAEVNKAEMSLRSCKNRLADLAKIVAAARDAALAAYRAALVSKRNELVAKWRAERARREAELVALVEKAFLPAAIARTIEGSLIPGPEDKRRGAVDWLQELTAHLPGDDDDDDDDSAGARQPAYLPGVNQGADLFSPDKPPPVGIILEPLPEANRVL